MAQSQSGNSLACVKTFKNCTAECDECLNFESGRDNENIFEWELAWKRRDRGCCHIVCVRLEADDFLQKRFEGVKAMVGYDVFPNGLVGLFGFARLYPAKSISFGGFEDFGLAADQFAGLRNENTDVSVDIGFGDLVLSNEALEEAFHFGNELNLPNCR